MTLFQQMPESMCISPFDWWNPQQMNWIIMCKTFLIYSAINMCHLEMSSVLISANCFAGTLCIINIQTKTMWSAFWSFLIFILHSIPSVELFSYLILVQQALQTNEKGKSCTLETSFRIYVRSWYFSAKLMYEHHGQYHTNGTGIIRSTLQNHSQRVEGIAIIVELVTDKA